MHVNYHIIAPPPALADTVRFYWVFEISGIDPSNPYVYRSLADGCAELVFHTRGTFEEATANGLIASADTSLHAQTDHFRRFEIQQDFVIFGAYIYPFALPDLCGYSAAALSNEMPDILSVWGNDGRILRENILTAAHHQQRADILSKFIIAKLDRAPDRKPAAVEAIKSLIQHKGNLAISDLAAQIGRSPRQLERLFQTYAGFSPKTFARILRFQAATQQFGKPIASLTSLALDCGYYDQAHFIHDFKQFSGYTPSEYFIGKPEGIEYKEA